MVSIPRDSSPESTAAFLRNPYGFISDRCRRYRSDLFDTRLMLQRTICMTGPEAAELLYESSRFMRAGAAPGRVQKTLFGVGGVQSLDDDAHLHRKHMLMSLMTAERIRELSESVTGWAHRYARKWASMDAVVLYDQLPELLTRAVCEWAGVPLADAEIAHRARQITALFDGAGSIGPPHWRSRSARKSADGWIAGVIADIRAGRLHPPEGTAAEVTAWHRDRSGNLLSPHAAAVELLNVLRPTVAVAVYITFIAHALQRNPECAKRVADGEDGYAELFVHEVRRFYPFFPALIAQVRHSFEWHGYQFPQGRRVLLDLHGTNHDPRAWATPEQFRPERFRHADTGCYTFIPQGGGDPGLGHRCAGEQITLALMTAFTNVLANDITYEVPEQDLRIDTTRLPAVPASRFIIRDVQMLH